MLLPITETQYAQNNQEFCTGDQTSFPYLKKICQTLRKSSPALNMSQILKCLSPPPTPATIHKSSKTATTSSRDVHALQKVHTWTGLSMMVFTTDSLSGVSNAKNILECKLMAVLEYQQCKKVIAWSGDCGMDQYVSWNLSSDELTLKPYGGNMKIIARLSQMKSRPSLTY